MILGIDEGYTYMKTVYGSLPEEVDIFKSTVKEGFESFGAGLKVEYEGNRYTIGSIKGAYVSDLSKVNNPMAELLLFTAIGKNLISRGKASGEKVHLVAGLPSGQYDKLKKEKKASLLGRKVNIVINGTRADFEIEKVIIMPQCSGLFLLEELPGEYIVIDFGGITVDVTEFSDGEPGKKRSYPLGMQILYAKLIDDINGHGAAYDITRGEEVLKTKEIIIDDEVKPYDPSNVINEHLKFLIDQNIKFDFPQYGNVKKKWIGGGAVACKEELKLEIDGSTQFTNAQIYYLVGVEKFGKKE